MPINKVGIDSYSLRSLECDPFKMLEWVKENGGSGIQFTELHLPKKVKLDNHFLEELKSYSQELDLYLEWGSGFSLPFDFNTNHNKKIYKHNLNIVKQASILGSKIVRCSSGGLFRFNKKSIPLDYVISESVKSFNQQLPFLREYNVTLAIETHFELTTFELLKIFQNCDLETGKELGICLDSLNLLTLMEHPIYATNRILDWVVATHIKNGFIYLHKLGFNVIPSELNKGVLNLGKIISLLDKSKNLINLSIEGHGGDFIIPIFSKTNRIKLPDLTKQEFMEILKLTSYCILNRNKLNKYERSESEWGINCLIEMSSDISYLIGLVEKLKTKKCHMD
ncbi:MAG: sugar phosphate isomerase/epimerase [Melioribacteraceae bacterium]|nr:sugar phosphate isomerase/epimerase [Melioribacteraceae bacterium]